MIKNTFICGFFVVKTLINLFVQRNMHTTQSKNNIRYAWYKIGGCIPMLGKFVILLLTTNLDFWQQIISNEPLVLIIENNWRSGKFDQVFGLINNNKFRQNNCFTKCLYHIRGICINYIFSVTVPMKLVYKCVFQLFNKSIQLFFLQNS